MIRKAKGIFVAGLMMVSSLYALAGAAGGTSVPPAFPAAGRGPTPNNDSEPNNDFNNATLITGAVTFDGGVGQGDLDYFKINLASGPTADTLTVTFTAHTGGGTRLTIFDPNRFEILYEDPGRELRLSFTAAVSGYYYIYLPELGPCNYTLATALGTAAFTTDGDNSPAQATPIFPTSDTPFSTAGTANNASDYSDFFKVHLNHSEMVSTDVLKGFLDAPPAGALSLMLYASGGHEPLAGYILPDPGLNQTLTFSPAAAGDYYLRVWAHHGGGQYSLKVSLFPGAADNNGMKEFASALTKTEAHWYNTSGDLTLGIDPDDFLLVENVLAGQTFNCTLKSTQYDPQDGTPDIWIRLHDALNELPPDPTDNLADPVANANARMLEAGNFYVQLNLTRWAGGYDLEVFTNSPPQLAASVPNITFWENTSDTSIRLVNVFYDPEDDPLTYTVTPLLDGWQDNITVTVGDDPLRTVTMTPASGWRGYFSMDISATDPYGETTTTNVKQVWVRGINHRPEVIRSEIDPIVLEKGKPDFDQLNLTSVFRDPDPGDRLFYNVTGNENIRVSFPKEIENQYYPTGAVMFVPNIGFVGTEIMYFTASDLEVLVSDPVMVTVEVREIINEKLTVTDPPRLVMDEDGPGVTINLASNVSSNLPGDTFTFEYVSASQNYTVRLTGSLANITPRAGFFGIEILEFNVSCSHGLKGVMRLTVETLWVNEPPTLRPLAPANWSVTISEGESVRFKIDASDRETPQAQLKVRWAVGPTNQTPGLEYLFETDYETVTTLEGSKLLVVRVTVNDTITQVTAQWNVTVVNVNRAPEDVRITFPPEGSAFEEGKRISFIGMGSDPDGDPLVFQWYEGTKLLGTGMEFNYSKLKAGKHNITLKVSDATASATSHLNVKVNAKLTPGFEAVWVLAAVAGAAVAAVALGRRKD
ncbi:MAG: hypothetical protein FJ149_01495 [Euryarchaeota archaeon]|nr:hypothetical protein [Euryarchaeota archaeon]